MTQIIWKFKRFVTWTSHTNFHLYNHTGK